MKRIAAIALVFSSFAAIGCAAGEPCTHVAQPVQLDSARPLALRVEGGSIWTAPNVVAEPHRAWNMPARGPVDGLWIGVQPATGGYVVSFRQGGIVWRGELDASRVARGPLEAMPEPVATTPADTMTAGR